MSTRTVSAVHRTAFVAGALSELSRVPAEMSLVEETVSREHRKAPRNSPRFCRRAGLETAKFGLPQRTAVGGACALNPGIGVYSVFSDMNFERWQSHVDGMIAGEAASASGGLIKVTPVAGYCPPPPESGRDSSPAGRAALSESLIFETRGCGFSVLDFPPADYRTSLDPTMQQLFPTSSIDARDTPAWNAPGADLNATPPTTRAATDPRRALSARHFGAA